MIAICLSVPPCGLRYIMMWVQTMRSSIGQEKPVMLDMRNNSFLDKEEVAFIVRSTGPELVRFTQSEIE